ncbi:MULTISPECIES: acyl-CoA/acyl-ACP dehydrogenase [Paraburkholderia]|uniref:Acyl-CoA dehydrogenase n=1 Tax=Paraburkholderia podalyriae TaxID=1938811 RepID=A0ABR7Q0C2_9BURK|nr:acyl-CoA/acyl-ACP dehydrogenase [Paraburkholderia podalyriae]MBC8751942.1 acyl-CoA dehydrogenase [Paraburkholderia podalyriae]
MDFKLSDDSLAMQASTQKVVNDLLGYEPHFHGTNEVHEDVDSALREIGSYGLSIPEEFGGTLSTKSRWHWLMPGLAPQRVATIGDPGSDAHGWTVATHSRQIRRLSRV